MLDALRKRERKVLRRSGPVQPRLSRATDIAKPRWAPWLGWGGHTRAASQAPKALAIDGELDLHNFSPKEVGKVVRSYIDEAQRLGQLELRIVHGKGKGVLRRTVHAELDRHVAVASFRIAGQGAGSWGATLVQLHPPH